MESASRVVPRVAVLLFIACCAVPLAWARGGGGCVIRGTPVLTPRGAVPIERVAAGDEVFAVTAAGLVRSRVRARVTAEPAVVVRIEAGGRTLRVSPEHPVSVGAGTFRPAGRLRVGESVRLATIGGRLDSVPIDSVSREACSGQAFDLVVSPGGTFVAGSVVVHNKGGGCFLPDTPILRVDGIAVPIGNLRAGDRVLAFTMEGGLVPSTVREVLVHEEHEILDVETDRSTLHVTPEHPFYMGDAAFRAADALDTGDHVFMCEGAGLVSRRVLSIRRRTGTFHVCNLRTDSPFTFFAAGVAVHNKGGGGFSGSRSHGGYRSGGHSSGGGDPMSNVVFPFAIFGGYLIWVVISALFPGLSERLASLGELDVILPRSSIQPKAARVARLLAQAAGADPSWQPAALEKLVCSTFLELQKCWQARDYRAMKDLLWPSLFSAHVQQLAGMKGSHEINRVEDVRIEHIDIVHVRCTTSEAEQEFTALITAHASDYYVDDRDGRFLRGNTSPKQFQEFWIFQRHGSRFALREIEQTRESRALAERDVCELARPKKVGEVQAEPLPTPPLPVAGSRIDRLLEQLAPADPAWNRRDLVERVREVFLRFYLAQQRGDPDQVPIDDLEPKTAKALMKRIAARRSAGDTIEFRGLCVRKVDIVLVRNFKDNTRDEFVARVSAHAKTIVRAGKDVREDRDLVLFERYCLFGRPDGVWKLVELQSPAGKEHVMALGAVDEDGLPLDVLPA